jgi:hypothetical protein
MLKALSKMRLPHDDITAAAGLVFEASSSYKNMYDRIFII